MNKIFRFLTVAVAAVSTLSLAACSDDDDDDNSNGSSTSVSEITGNKWVLNTSKSSAYTSLNGIEGESDMSETTGNNVIPTAFTFNADGTAEVEVEDLTSDGTYTLKGKEFSCTYTVETELTGTGGLASKTVQAPFTLEKGTDLTQWGFDLLNNELGTSASTDEIGSTTYTTCELTKSGDQLILNLVLDIDYNTFDISDSEMSDEMKDLFNNMLNADNYVKYRLVYEKQ